MIEPEIVNSVSIVPQQQTSPQVSHKQQLQFFDRDPEEMIAFATRVANSLKKIIIQQKLAVHLNGKDHVKVEGWITMGSLLGFLPKEEYVKHYKDGTYEVGISLVRQSDGKIISSASAICGGDERNWKNRDKFARRSMAATRATGKAYRLAFGWVMSLAGYNPTPAEEVFTENKNEEIEIPFHPGEPDTYTGTPTQKIKLAKIFSENKITAPDKMKIANDVFIKHKLEVDELDAGVKELIKDGII